MAIGAVGLLALLVGLGAWRSSVPAMVVVAVLCLPAVLLRSMWPVAPVPWPGRWPTRTAWPPRLRT